MRTNMACWALAVSTLVALSGCSNGSGSSLGILANQPLPIHRRAPRRAASVRRRNLRESPRAALRPRHRAPMPQPLRRRLGQPWRTDLAPRMQATIGRTPATARQPAIRHTISVNRRRRHPGDHVRLWLRRNSLHGKHRRRAGAGAYGTPPSEPRPADGDTDDGLGLRAVTRQPARALSGSAKQLCPKRQQLLAERLCAEQLLTEQLRRRSGARERSAAESGSQQPIVSWHRFEPIRQWDDRFRAPAQPATAAANRYDATASGGYNPTATGSYDRTGTLVADDGSRYGDTTRTLPVRRGLADFGQRLRAVGSSRYATPSGSSSMPSAEVATPHADATLPSTGSSGYTPAASGYTPASTAQADQAIPLRQARTFRLRARTAIRLRAPARSTRRPIGLAAPAIIARTAPRGSLAATPKTTSGVTPASYRRRSAALRHQPAAPAAVTTVG